MSGTSAIAVDPDQVRTLSDVRASNNEQAPDAVTALDRSELPRMRALGYFLLVVTTVSAASSLVVESESLPKQLFWITCAGMFGVAWVLIWLTGTEARYRSAPTGAIWIFGGFAQAPIFYYYSPFSGSVVLPMLILFLVGLSYRRWVSNFALAITLVVHLSIALPIALHWMADVGTLRPAATSRHELLIAELLILQFVVASFLFGRWVRYTNMQAAAELERATRAVAERDAVLNEARQELQRAAWIGGPGRFTDQALGAYRLGVVIGRGGMGEVYAAEHVETKQPAAVKLLHRNVVADPDNVARFVREAQAAQAIRSAHVVQMFDISPRDAPTPYIAMERLDGHDLAFHLRAERRFAIARTVKLVTEVAAGLEAARLAGVVHRDLKPQNVYLHDNNGSPVWKILDFGLSKLGDHHGTLTKGQVIGTPAFMAPEQARGDDVDHRADVYSLGALMYRTLTGLPAFSGDDVFGILTDVMTRMPQRPSELVALPHDVDSVIAIAMAKAPDDRFQTAAELADAFARATTGELTEATRQRAERLVARLPWGRQSFVAG